MRRLLAALAVLQLAACAQFTPAPLPEVDVDLPAEMLRAQKPRGGGVFSEYGSPALVSDRVAFRPGDILTVVLEEATQASKKAGTSFGKESSAEIKPLVIGNKTYNTTVGIEADRGFDGSSSSTQQNRLSGALTVVVHKVLPNGLLLIKGEKQLALNQGEGYLKLAGLVRTDDIDAGNRVSSLRIANARIAYSGRGVLHDANSAGWLTRFFTSPLMPF